MYVFSILQQINAPLLENVIFKRSSYEAQKLSEKSSYTIKSCVNFVVINVSTSTIWDLFCHDMHCLTCLFIHIVWFISSIPHAHPDNNYYRLCTKTLLKIVRSTNWLFFLLVVLQLTSPKSWGTDSPSHTLLVLFIPRDSLIVGHI